MKHLKAEFKKLKNFNYVSVFFSPGAYLVMPTRAQTKKLALEEIKIQLHKMVDEL